MSSQQPSRQPILRVRTGCFTCRSRKKKCDEVKPICTGCKRNKLSCRWPTASQIQYKPSADASKRQKAAQYQKRDEDTAGIDFISSDDGCHASDASPADAAQDQSPTSSESSSSSVAELTSTHVVSDTLPFDDSLIDVNILNQIEPQCLEHGDSMDLAQSPVASASAHGFGSLPSNLAMLPGLEGPSFELLGHYLSRTALSMGNGSTDVNPFVSQVIPLCFANSFILELVLCQSANHRASEDATKATIAQRYYNKSLQLFRNSIDDYVNGKEASPLWIAIGALIMCFTETAKGDVNGIIFDHINAAGPLLAGLVTRTDLIRNDLRDFIVEYYVYTATISMISIDPAFSSTPFLSPELELQARNLTASGYVGQLSGCWLELLLLIPQIFEFGRKSRTLSGQGFPAPDDFIAFSRLQAQILAFDPSSLLGYEVRLCGQIYKHAIHIYLLTSLDAQGGSREQLAQAINNSVEEAFYNLDQLPWTSRINTTLSWALAVLGTCLPDKERRERLRSRLQVMFLTIGLGNIRATLALLEKIWESQNMESSPWIICKAMQDHEMWISFG